MNAPGSVRLKTKQAGEGRPVPSDDFGAPG